MEAISPENLVNYHLYELNSELSNKLEGDCVFINSVIFPPLEKEFRIVLENLKNSNANCKQTDHLIVLLQTTGGMMETVERLVAIMRQHYKCVSFVIPDYAYSAGTVLALSGDNIFMDYYSVLGPIDPQYPSEDGSFLSGHGYLSKYEELVNRINNASANHKVRAELAFLIRNFDPAKLFQFEQSIEHGISLITDWLPKYKFSHWNKTKSRGKTVTDRMKRTRAKTIAKILGDASKWHSHGRGITMSRLREDDLKLEIDDFSNDGELMSMIKNYHGLAINFARNVGIVDFLHYQDGFRRVQ